MTHAETATPLIWYKNKRVWRTMFSQTLTIITLAPAVIAIATDYWPSEFLALAAVQAVAVQGAITRIMAIERVNLWLAKIGLGSAPIGELTK